jgi:hypothetical protein
MITNYMTRELLADWLDRARSAGLLPAERISGEKPVLPKTDGCSERASGPDVVSPSPSNLLQ